ncbi:transmembrane protein, putative [Medicago truncatula]|uniref:Transmembrane protein, putative n=1 Tax=Medicago truncatula TaxID=3880 RepID=A0A072UQA2_MEDTR|nr:transmembrane protein, putative [Medicago truncatula]
MVTHAHVETLIKLSIGEFIVYKIIIAGRSELFKKNRLNTKAFFNGAEMPYLDLTSREFVRIQKCLDNFRRHKM